MIEYNIYLESNSTENGCIITLPGRGQDSDEMVNFVRLMELNDTLIVSPTPYHRAWYPMPFGIEDQAEAIEGLNAATEAINKLINKITGFWDIPRNKIILNGFSAGAVVALLTAVKYQPIGAVYINSGAILDPEAFPQCQCSDTKFLLRHNVNDEVFSWEERYLPMKRTLIDKNYDVSWVERPYGNHHLFFNDIVDGAKFLSPILGYVDWKHSTEE